MAKVRRTMPCDMCGNTKEVWYWPRDDFTCCDDCTPKLHTHQEESDKELVRSTSHGEIWVYKETGEWA
jgi:hypothetical protein